MIFHCCPGIGAKLQLFFTVDLHTKSRFKRCNLAHGHQWIPMVERWWEDGRKMVGRWWEDGGKMVRSPRKSFMVAASGAEADVPSLALALRDFISCNVDPKLPLHIELLVKWETSKGGFDNV